MDIINRFERPHSTRRTRSRLALVALLAAAISSTTLNGQEGPAPQWIWSPEHTPGSVPQDACFFRKTIHLQVEHRGKLLIAADDEFEAYINGKKVAAGNGATNLQSFEIAKPLREGKNTIAIKVVNRNGGTAGLAAILEVECDAVPKRRFLTNSTWRTQLSVLPLWSTNGYRDKSWKPAKVVGTFGEDLQNGQAESSVATSQQREVRADVANQGDSEYPEFRLAPGFQIQHVAGGDETGSLIAMAFNEFGQIVASREGGSLILIYDSNENQVPDAVRVLSDDVRNCQGILPLNGSIFVVGDGPRGSALYRLEDNDRDGGFETIVPLVRFEGTSGEHGPHGIALGPDGLIYVALGNETKLAAGYDVASPYRNYYEGDLVPRYDDPQGKPTDGKAPGGGVLRVDAEGRRRELLAGGLHDAYDLAFNSRGDLFMHDSNKESNRGTPWARPTRLLQIVPGGEYGWRSGWSNWPEYWADSLPAVMHTGRGTPRGAVFYEHNAYPAKFRSALFSCDWSEGRIFVYHLQPRGAGYAAQAEVFLEGRPLNVTDIDVGPDGWIYFCTGGRGTQGNLYRVVVESAAPAIPPTGVGVLPAVRQPQPRSAWGRQAISIKRHRMGGQWDFELRAFVGDRSQDGADRAQALGLMHLVGPPPTDTELIRFATDPDPRVRRQAARLLGLIGNQPAREALEKLLSDQNPLVRRQACESIARAAGHVAFETLSSLLKSGDRFESTAARRLLERTPSTEYEGSLLATNDARLFANGAMARLIASPDPQIAIQLVNRVAALSQGTWVPDDFLWQLRVVELAVERASLRAEDLPVIDLWLAKQFPSEDPRVNREIVRLLVALQSSQALDAMLATLDGDAPQEEKLHVGFHLRFLRQGWTPAQKARLLAFYEEAGGFSNGGSLGGYLDQVAADFLMRCSAEERQAILDRGEQMPSMALASLFQLEEAEDAVNVDRLIALDRRLPESDDEVVHNLRIGIMAILARHGDERSMTYLRDVYDRDPTRRPAAAMGLAQAPDGPNWDYLVRSIPLLEAEPAKEVLVKLREVEFAPEEIEYYRQVILCGLRLRDNGGMLASQLLEHWVGRKPDDLGVSWETVLPAWQRWFEAAHPSQPKPDLPEETGQNTWTLDDLETYLASDEGRAGSIEQGRLVFKRAMCSNCHVHGRIGENFAPELTALSKRFQKREVLESLLFPSQVVSDQYVAYQITTTDNEIIVGQVIPQPNTDFLIVGSNGETATVAEAEIAEILRSRVSAMPEGLINDLSLQEIADLFAFLMHQPAAAVAER